jgi:hypothetical protein
MLFSFASVAISIWLGLVAIGCLRRLWRASANDGSGYSGRDYPRAVNSENHHRHRDLGSEGLISTISQSLIAVSHALTNVIRAMLSRAREWISRMFRRSEISHPFLSPTSTVTLGTSNPLPESEPASPNNEPARTDPSDQAAGAIKRKRAPSVRKQTPETRLKLSQPRQRKTSILAKETIAETSGKSPNDQSERRSRRINKLGASAGKKSARAKPKISTASNTALAPKTSV